MLTAPISVVIPIFNNERFIREAIDSVQGQSVGVVEIIVVDNNSSDASRHIAEELGTKVVDEKKQGTPAARNRGLRFCSQEWIGFLDADDVWEKNKIELQWTVAQNFSSAGIIFSDYHVLDNSSLFTSSEKNLEKRWDNLNNRLLIGDWASYFPSVEADFFIRFSPLPSTVMVRRDVFSIVGMFDDSVTFLDDLEFFWRAVARFPVAIVERPLVRYRRHEHNASHDLDGKRQGFFSLVKRMVANPEKYPPGAGQLYKDKIMEPFVNTRLKMKQSS